ncbi:MAG TPA: phosphoesterase [Planctomycetes bacterium]|nr:phosphoesterase [Planctomycetota bacterium]
MRPKALLPIAALCAACTSSRPGPLDPVGRRPDGATLTPVNQFIEPYGATIELDGMRPQALALSADGSRIFVSGKSSELVVLDARDGAVLQRVGFPAAEQRSPARVSDHELDPDGDAQLSFTGLITSPDGRFVYVSNVNGSIKVFAVASDGSVSPSHSIPLPPANAPRRREEIPSGLALSEDGTRLFVCGNLSNRLLEIDTASGACVRAFDVGVAPFDVRIVAGRAFVTNWGGRRPREGERVGPAGLGTVVATDERGIANQGSVSIVDLDGNESTAVREVRVGRHACALAPTPDRRLVVVANAGDDTLSVLDASTGKVVRTISCRSHPADLLSATPNALAFDARGERLFVANGTENAIGVFEFDGDEPEETALVGLIPVGWFPGALAFDAPRGRVVVANIKGLGFGRPREGEKGPEFNTHQYHGSVNLVPIPGEEELARLSARVDLDLRRSRIEASLAPPRPDRAPVAIPERIGEPSRIRHVVYIIKENRTFDQVLGDLAGGDGDPSLCVFGEEVTPNTHAIAREFVLLDNTYCAGILSADGHNWSTSAYASDYLERSFAGWARSYPDGMTESDKDALAYSPAGFLWDHALAAGRSVRNFGEFCQSRVRWRDPTRTGEPDFLACWRTWRGRSDEVVFGCEPVVPSLDGVSVTSTVGWNMNVPDQLRADEFLADLARCEANGEYPELTIVCLPNNHTSGTAEGAPTPRACVADNDLALGRMLEGLSHSSFWDEMAVFVIEDDPQAGWDHVSGYRTCALVASPFARRGAVVSRRYNTTSVLRTIEAILGFGPMNLFDASADPMFECFTDEPDPTPFVARSNRVPLDEMNPSPAALGDREARDDALASAAIDWSGADRAPEDLLNRILWRAVRGDEPYPEWAIHAAPDED